MSLFTSPTRNRPTSYGGVSSSPMNYATGPSPAADHSRCEATIRDLQISESRLRAEVKRIEAEYEQYKQTFWRRYDEQQQALRRVKDLEGAKEESQRQASHAERVPGLEREVRELKEALTIAQKDAESKGSELRSLEEQLATDSGTLRGQNVELVRLRKLEADYKQLMQRVERDLGASGDVEGRLRTILASEAKLSSDLDTLKRTHETCQIRNGELASGLDVAQKKLLDVTAERDELDRIVRSVDGEKAVMNKERDVLLAEAQRWRQSFDSLEIRHDEAVKERDALSRQMITVTKECEASQKNAEMLENRNTTLENRYAALQDDFAQKSHQFEEMKSARVMLEYELNALKPRVPQLEAEVSRVNALLQESASKLQQAQLSNNQLQHEFNFTKSELARVTEAHDRVSAENARTQDVLQEARTKLRAAEYDASHAQQQLAAQTEELAGLRQNLNDKSATALTATAHLEAVKATLVERDNEIANSRRQWQSDQDALRELRAKVDRLSDLCAQKEESFGTMERELETLAADLASMRNQDTATRRALSGREAEVKELQRQLDNATASLHQAQEENATLKSAVTAEHTNGLRSQGALETCNAQLRAAQEQCAVLRSELETSRQDDVAQRQELSALRLAQEEYKRQQDDAARTQRQHAQQISQTARENEALAKQLVSAQASYDTCQQQLTSQLELCEVLRLELRKGKRV